MANTKHHPRVALLIEASTPYRRGLLRGIHAYACEHGPWLIHLLEAEQGDTDPAWFSKHWKGDGIIAHAENRRLHQIIRDTQLPVIDLRAQDQSPNAPTVASEQALVAKLAVDHLVERGFKQFGFYGDDRFTWAIRRKESFAALLEQVGYPCSVHTGTGIKRRGQIDWEQEDEQLAAWIRRLPAPAGVMASHDFHAWRILEICQQLNISVPDEIAVIGVDNDELLCDLASPPLTSIRLDTFRIGYEAARMLDEWMAGKRPTQSLQVPPVEVVTRQSTDVLAISDSEISQAVRFIREHACEGIKVDDVLRAVPLSRSVFEYRFKKLLGHTPHAEILRVQFQRVKQLLLQTELSVAAIARLTGFRHAEYMTVAFKQHFHITPRKYRETHPR